jgi:hypothetical protein
MPCDYSKYPKNWKSEIRPAILTRAKNRCENCKIPNLVTVSRGDYFGTDAWQDDDGNIFCGATSEKIGEDYVGALFALNGRRRVVNLKVVLTVAHIDHDTTNNELENLKALCQRCHLRHDAVLHRVNSRNTFNQKRGLISLFSD